MNASKTAIVAFALWATGAGGSISHCFALPPMSPQRQETGQSANTITKRIGVIKAINGNTVILSQDSGPEATVIVESTTRIVRIVPGEKNIENAPSLPLQELQIGDRIVVRGKASDDAKSMVASSIMAMKRSDTRRERDLQDWQKRGLSGIVAAVDAATDTVKVSVAGFGNTKIIAIHSSNATVVRRYAPDSVKFEDAKLSSLQDIHPGDQLRARGDRNADGTELAAEEMVTGTFRNIAGTINSVDVSSGAINLQDLRSKKQVEVKVTNDSQLHMLSAEKAQRFAMRLEGAAGVAGIPGAGASPPAGATGPSTANAQPAPPGDSSPGTWSNGGGAGGGMRSAGAPDLQQVLSHTPTLAVADLHKGDAVVILATEGTSSSASTVITLVSGVEAILQAAPNGSQATILSPWSLSAPAGDAASQ